MKRKQGAAIKLPLEAELNDLVTCQSLLEAGVRFSGTQMITGYVLDRGFILVSELGTEADDFYRRFL